MSNLVLTEDSNPFYNNFNDTDTIGSSLSTMIENVQKPSNRSKSSLFINSILLVVIILLIVWIVYKNKTSN